MDYELSYQNGLDEYKSKRSKCVMNIKEFKDRYGIESLAKAKKIVSCNDFPKVVVGSQILIIESKVEEWFISNIGERIA